MKVIPAPLTQTIKEFEEIFRVLPKYFNRFHIDVADGILVPNKTTPVDDIVNFFKNHPSVTKNRKLILDFHLMVTDFDKELKKIQQLVDIAQISTIFINATLEPDLEELGKKYNSLKLGLDIFPAVQIETVVEKYDLNKVSAIQIMTVEPGFQGQPFLPHMMDKIEQLYNHHYRANIFIDGSVNENTIPLIISQEYKPDYLCIGSYLCKSGEHLDSRISYLRSKKLLD